MRLSKTDQRLLQAASDVMLRPFEFAHLTDYLKASAAMLNPILGSYASVSGVLDSSGAVHVVSDDYPSAAIEAFKRWKLADAGTERAHQRSAEVVSMRTIVGMEWDGLEQDSMVNEWYYPHGVADVIATFIRWPEDGAFASVEWHHRRFGTARMGADGEAILNLLTPSLRAGARLLYTAGEHRLRLARNLDALGVTLCICAHDGAVVHIAAALQSLIGGDPDRDRIMTRVSWVAREVARSTARETPWRADQPPVAHEVVHTSVASYRLSAARAAHAMQFGATDILVIVGRLTSSPLRALDIAERYSMTRRESEVAERLGQGLRNAEIAEALQLSPHTVRRHTERVLAKLGVRSRAEAAARLRG